jgi:hypothetical protein
MESNGMMSAEGNIVIVIVVVITVEIVRCMCAEVGVGTQTFLDSLHILHH